MIFNSVIARSEVTRQSRRRSSAAFAQEIATLRSQLQQQFEKVVSPVLRRR
jgi:hypothetical protein